ncbi:translation elongation factor Ts [Fimbriiglobus ruber]|uniref:Elongation factor Ts n=1 Tax=Fimbriiglobus ruber TaxID=1908690 RepID=A0A225E602_9BACT|nr:translation elongation factor Ts [Fimbriiglobus ruber]OWK43847.1 Translation elongation factor Ts [Fimbriiglobus ruber]
MSTITAAAVNDLRKRTDLPLMDCKSALVEAGGDPEKAIEILRSRNAKAAVKREANETAEGRIGVAIDAAKQQAGIVEMRCESAPSAKSDQYIALTNDIAKHVAAHPAKDVAELLTQPFGTGTIKDRIDETVGLIREKMIVQRFTRLTGGVFGQYVHHDGTVGVLLHCTGTGGNDEALRDICAHIAALNPQYISAVEIPGELVEKEKAMAMAQIKEDPKNAGKPANIVEKIAEGKLKTWMAEIVLTEQPMANTAKYPGQTVGQVLQKQGLTATKFIRYKVGATAV